MYPRWRCTPDSAINPYNGIIVLIGGATPMEESSLEAMKDSSSRTNGDKLQNVKEELEAKLVINRNELDRVQPTA